MNENYKGSIELISGLKQKNDVDFPLMEAHAVAVYETDALGSTTEIRLDEKLRRLKEESSVSDQAKKEIIDAAVDAVFVDEDYKKLTESVGKNSTAIFAAETGLDYRVKELETQVEEGDNKELKVQFEEKESMLYLYTGDELIKPNPDDDSVISNVISSTPVSGGGGAGASLNYRISLKVLDKASSLTFLHTDIPKINFMASFTDTTAEEGEDNLVPQTINFKLTITLPSGVKNTYSFTGPSNTALDYDLTPLVSSTNGLILGDHSVTLAASYTQEVGEEATPVTIQSTKKWIVKITEMYLTSSFEDANTKSGNVPFTVTVYGDLNKTIHYNFNGQEDWMKTENASLSNYDYTITIPKQEHGNYPLEVYLTADVNGTLIKSNSLFYDIMFVDENINLPIIRAVLKEGKGQQYSNIPIKYSVYSPLTLLSDVELAVDGEVVSTLTGVDRSEQTWNYKPMDFGTKTLTITSGPTIRTLQIEVEKFPYDIEGVKAGLELDFLPQGRTNQDADYDVFHNNVFDELGEEVPLTWNISDNFDWINGGWKIDDKGDSYFCIKAGTSVDINYYLFNDEHTLVGANKSKGNGKEFKIIFKTTNVARPDTTWLSCIAAPEIGDPLGIQLDAHTGYVRTSSASNYLDIPYSEEDKIEFDINIVPITYDTEGTIDLTQKDIAMIMPYEDGTPARPLILDNDQISFKQATPVPITIGSPYCDVHIYRMKAYSTFLSEKNILNNFIADAPNAEEMIDRYLRNQIYDAKTGKLTPESFAAACPHMRVIKISAPRFTNDKKDKVLETEVEMIYKNGDPLYDNWKAVYARHNGQGTSSNAYGYAGRNLELSLKEKETLRYKITRPEGVYNEDGDLLVFGTVVEGKQDFFLDESLETIVEDVTTIATVTTIPGTTITLGDGETTAKKVSLTRDSVPTNYFNIKVNIASSEHANNALLQKRYDRYLPYTSYASAVDDKVKNNMNFYNCVIFIQERNEDLTTHQEFNDNDWHFYSLGNIGDSKKTDDTRANDPDDTTEFCVEIMDWNRELSAFPQDTKVQANAEKYVKKDGNNVITGYIFITEENLASGLLFERDYTLQEYQEQNEDGSWISYGYKVSEDITLDSEHLDKYYIDILELDDYSEDYTYGFRYLNDDEDSEQIATAKAKWNEFYRFITRNNYYDDRRADESGKWLEDPDKIAAWKSEFENWFIKDAAFYYYLFTLRYTMVDNRAKNSFWHWGKCIDNKYRMDFWDYDNDTALGIDNTGKFTMSYGVEDHDTNEGGAAHFRAHNSTFFVRVADYFAEELISYYKDTLEQLNPQVFSSTSLINEFDNWQSEFPEEAWRLQYENIYKRTYVGGYGSQWDNRVNPTQIKKAADPQFLTEMMNGKKKYQRRQFERNQDVYMSSKFFGNTVFQNYLKLRGGGDMDPNKFIVKPNGDITITPYLNMYINTSVEHNSTFNHHIKVKAGESVTLKYPTNTLEFNYIYGASYLQSLGDLSAMYLRTAELNNGRRLKQIVLGNATEGYDNPNLETVAITSNNKLLEELDVRNMSKLGGNIPINVIPSLRKLYAQGTGYQTVQFANNGLIEEAYLPASINKIVATNLYYLHTLEIADYNNLQSLVISNCPQIDEFEIVSSSKNLKTIRVTDIEWTMENTDLLNKLANCTGIGADGVTSISQSVLTGYVHVDAIRQTELDRYKEIWPELEVHYTNIIPQWNLNFYNEGADIFSDEPIYTYKIDTNTILYPELHDPAKNGMLKPEQLPTKPDSEDGQFEYVFKGWNPSMEPTIVNGEEKYITVTQDINFFADFDAVTKMYTISWYGHNRKLLQTSTVPYGGTGVYTGETPTRVNQANAYFLFNGWDSSSANITGNKEIIANWVQADPGNLSSSNSEELHSVEIYSLAQNAKDTNNTSLYNETLGLDKKIKVQMGYMPDFENVTSTVFEEAMKEYNGLKSDVVVTNKYLFDKTHLEKGFTLAIDFTPKYQTSKDNVFVSCYNSQLFGFKLQSPSNVPQFMWNSNILKLYGAKNGYTTSETYNNFREICVIRYSAEEKTIYFYTNDRYSLDDIYEQKITLPITNWEYSFAPLTFGGNVNEDGTYSTLSYMSGIIHYAKLWEDDLGSEECKKICSWVYDEYEFEQVTDRTRYQYSSTSEEGSKLFNTTASFVATELMERPVNFFAASDYSLKYPGWHASQIRTWLNTKVLKGMSLEWQQILLPTVIYSLGNQGDSNLPSIDGDTAETYYNQMSTIDKLYIPALAEIIPNPSANSTSKAEKYLDDLGGARNLSSYPQYTEDNSGRIRNLKGTDISFGWWTRTPNLNNPRYYKGASSTGDTTSISYKHDKDPSKENRYFSPHTTPDTSKFQFNMPCSVLLAFSI